MGSVCSIRVSRDHRLFVSFPRLFADFHARHRLLTPRHPPCALGSLTIGISNSHAGRNDPHRLNDTRCATNDIYFAMLPSTAPFPCDQALTARPLAIESAPFRTARIVASSSRIDPRPALCRTVRQIAPDAPEELRSCSPLARQSPKRPRLRLKHMWCS